MKKTTLVLLFACACFGQTQTVPVMIVPLGWSICKFAPQLCNPNLMPLKGFEPDALLISARGSDTIGFKYLLIGIAKETGEVRKFEGAFEANSNKGGGVANSVTINAGALLSAFVTITEIQRDGSLMSYQEEIKNLP